MCQAAALVESAVARRASLKIVWAALLAAMLAFLAAAAFLRPRLGQADGLGVLTWMAIAWCVLSTITAVVLRSVASEAPDAAKGDALRIASLATLESGALLAGLSHLVSPLDYGIYGAFLPLAAFLAFFPRET
jgi:hypothetical protein